MKIFSVGVLVNFALGLSREITSDLTSEVEYSRSRGRELRKLRKYSGPDRTLPITPQFLNSLLAKKDRGEELTPWENAIKRYQFKPTTNNSEYWANLPPVSGFQDLIEACVSLVGKDNVYILSAPVEDKGDCILGKRQWLSQHTHFADDHIFITQEKEKRLVR